MKKNYSIILAILSPLAIGLFFAGTLFSSSSPGAKTGSPGDNANCTACHSGNTTEAVGWITTDIPALGYIVGETYNITASPIHSGAGKIGFEFTAEDESNAKVGQFAISGDGETTLVNGDKAITHTNSGTTPSGGMKTWTFQWTAPSTDVGLVTFYAAFNATNNNGSTSGDVVYLSSISVEESSIGIDNSIENTIFSFSPNPSNGYITLNHNFGSANLMIIDLSGKTVLQEAQVFTNTRMDLSFLDSGIYLVRIQNGLQSRTERLIIK